MELRILLSIAAIYMALVGLGFIFAPQAIGIGAVPTDASAALMAYLRLFGSPFLGIAVLNWTARHAIILGNIVGFGAIAALDVWGLFSGARPLTKVFAIVHLLFAVAFIWVGRMSMSAKTSSAAQVEVEYMKITVETTVAASIEEVWRAWTTPDDIKQWCAASDDWHTTSATVDLRVGGTFSSRMEAKDGSMGFDIAGTYTKVVPQELLEYTMTDDRVVVVEFIREGGGVKIRETFDAEGTYTPEQQRQGWQAILDRFARYVEARR